MCLQPWSTPAQMETSVDHSNALNLQLQLTGQNNPVNINTIDGEPIGKGLIQQCIQSVSMHISCLHSEPYLCLLQTLFSTPSFWASRGFISITFIFHGLNGKSRDGLITTHKTVCNTLNYQCPWPLLGSRIYSVQYTFLWKTISCQAKSHRGICPRSITTRIYHSFCWQARWELFFNCFKFVLFYQLRLQNTKTNDLSRISWGWTRNRANHHSATPLLHKYHHLGVWKRTGFSWKNCDLTHQIQLIS